MQVIPYVTATKDVRVIDSKIGKVMPLADIAKALGYNRQNLHEMIKKNEDLFEGTFVTVTMTNEITQKSKTGELYTRTRDHEVKALNHYGVFGLLMKLDYNRIQDEAKKANVIRFQRWAMETLGNVASGTVARKATREVKKLNRSNTTHYNHVLNTFEEVHDDVETYNKQEAADKLGISIKSIYRHVVKGYIRAYKRFNFYKHWEYAFLKSDIDAIVLRKENK